MDHRHFPNSFRVETSRGRHRNRATAEHSYTQTGRAAFPENGPLVHPMNNVPRGRYHRTTNWNAETNEYHSNSSMQVPHLQRSFPRPSYDRFPQSSAAGNEYLPSQNNSTLSHPSHRYNVNHYPHGPQETRSRGALKRKGPQTSVAYEGTSSSRRFYGPGSSSTSFELPQRKQSSHIDYSHSEVSRGYGSFSAGEDSARNVRRRSSLDLEASSMQTNVSNYTSHYRHPPTHPPNHHGAADPCNTNGVECSQNWNFGTMPRAANGGVQTAGATGFSNGNINPHVIGGSYPEMRSYPSNSISGRDMTSSSQYTRPPIQSVQSARGRRSSHSMREIPPYNSGPNYYSTRHEPTSTENRVSSYRHSSQSGRGWANSYSSRTNGIAVERFRSIASAVDAHGRIGSQDLMMELPAFYASSHNLFDQYRDMRLDIDEMSYEELLALGESIGNVNTGLSNDVISLSLTEDAYSLVQNSTEESCAICLEEYANEVKIGTVKNCGHNYHADCIKKWLSMKNACPICKASAHKDGVNEE